MKKKSKTMKIYILLITFLLQKESKNNSDEKLVFRYESISLKVQILLLFDNVLKHSK